MKGQYRIGDFPFSVESDEDMLIPDNMKLFEESGKTDYSYMIRIGSLDVQDSGDLVLDREEIQVYSRDGRELRRIGWAGSLVHYACYTEVADLQSEITVDSAFKDYLHLDTAFNALLALERRFIDRDGLILHCAYMAYEGQAILFSAPSETGKSTQADLWEQYRGSRTINGDRGLLQKKDGRWWAHGWPVCGSSKICHNESYPIRAIVMLSQAKENSVERLRPAQAWGQVYSQITINRWNGEAHNHAMDLIEDLVGNVPVYHLACNISEDAVKCLEDALLGAE